MSIREEFPYEIRMQDVSFSYSVDEENSVKAVEGLSFSVEKGEYIALLGRNGSGKSSVAKLINVLEFPDDGRVYVMGYLSTEQSTFWEIRENCGMVFQNPDNQIVGTTVEEDVAFGPENLGIPSEEIRRRVDEALTYVGLEAMALRQPSALSGGQKQRLAIAGILAMQPRIMILDESTSMLDPGGREDFLALVERLIEEKGITVVHITHDMNEAARADRLIVLSEGKVALEGTPAEVFSQRDVLRELDLDVPIYAELLYSLAAVTGVSVASEDIVSREVALDRICEILGSGVVCSPELPEAFEGEAEALFCSGTPILEVKNLSHVYDTESEPSIADISFEVYEGECLAVIGQSGSGKTTLITHLNGLLRPQKGEVLLRQDGKLFSIENKKDIRVIRSHVGLLFQYPEYQLFEETVEKDVGFGPKMMGLPPDVVKERVIRALELVGLDESFLARSPFGISGGQKRRVAFAGILAMEPDVLVLDEPAAGLDPAGRREIFSYIRELKRRKKTVILVSHNMDEAVSCCDRVLVLESGKGYGPWSPDALFADSGRLADLGVRCPELVSCLWRIRESFPTLNPRQYSMDDAVRELLSLLVRRKAE